MQVRRAEVEFPLLSKDQAESEFGLGTIELTEFPRRRLVTVDLEPTDAQPAVVLSGFEVAFDPSGDGRPLGNLQVEANLSGEPEAVMVDGEPRLRVTVEVIFGLRDWSEDWDDAHEGIVYVSVIA